MEIPEFIDTYSDDIISLQEGRNALLTHSLRRESKDLCDASFCRIFAIMMVGSIETMLEAWRERDSLGILDSYFAARISNGDRVASLFNAFNNAGINVDREVFNDYLAIKYLRNVVVHARWKDYEKEWLEHRGFPADTRELTEQHWKKMQSVNRNMMLYIALTSIAKPEPPTGPSSRVIKLSETEGRDEMGIFRVNDLPTIIWFNLERIDHYIYKNIETAALADDYVWTKGFTVEEVERLSHNERKRLFYLAARRAGESGFPPLEAQRSLGKEALSFWKEYWRLTFGQHRIACDDLEQSTKVLEHLHNRNAYPKAPITPLLHHRDLAIKLIQKLIDRYEPFTEEEVLSALWMGEILYEIMPNIMPVTLFVLGLPIVDPHDTRTYIEEGKRALVAFKLRTYWYMYVEHKTLPNVDWHFYDDMCELFLSRTSIADRV